MYLVYVATLGDFNISNFFVSKCKLVKERHLRDLEELLFLKIHTFTSTPFCISLRVFAAVQMFSIFKNFRFFLKKGGGAAFFKIKPKFEFFPNYRLHLHSEQLSILHSQVLTIL